MNLNNFFYHDNQYKLKKNLIIYILSLVDSCSLKEASRVNKKWCELIKQAHTLLMLLPTIHKIPKFNNLGLDTLELKKLSGGMSNKTYLIKSNLFKEKWVLRVPGKTSSFLINRSEESNNAQNASRLGLNVPIEYFDKRDGLQLTQFIENASTVNETTLKRKVILQKIARIFRKLHNSEPCNESLDFFQRNENIITNLRQNQFVFPYPIDLIEKEMNKLKDLFFKYSIKKYPCHNDSIPANFLLSSSNNSEAEEENIYLIDWEYSMNNDFMWDLVFFFIVGKLSADQQSMFLLEYFGNESYDQTSIDNWCIVYKPIIEWWTTLWSWSQFACKSEIVPLEEYQNLADHCYKSTVNHLKSEFYKNAIQCIENESTHPSFTGNRKFHI